MDLDYRTWRDLYGK
ncbi:hypothetical protein NHI66_002329 [Clostridium botulinum]|nr:hypothetical protein [Clostridium botulinum]